MARPKKGEEKSKEKPKDAAVLQVSVEDFKRSRDSVVAGFDTLSTAVHQLSRAYIVHTNTVLGHAPGATLDLLETPAFPTSLTGKTLVAAVPSAKDAAAAAAEAEDGKKKKKRYHDPNAPKRPLTPYFLYMQSARPVITSDLGGEAKPGAISAEGTRRWKAMTEEEKALWKVAYEASLPEYRKRVAAYKASTGGGDAAAAQLAAENGAVTEEEADVLAAEAEEPAVEAPAPAKAPKAARRRKSGKAEETPKATSDAPVPSKVTPVAPPGVKASGSSAPASKEGEKEGDNKKKRKRSDRKSQADEVSHVEPTPVESVKKPESQASGKEKRASKKKRKSAAGDD
ncbi:MAG: hypothetical protein M1838_003404 [Thelocarpon superellum]|nr:MAG: hypothetical protein M1838_003404 [Thelocarpon superellum]